MHFSANPLPYCLILAVTLSCGDSHRENGQNSESQRDSTLTYVINQEVGKPQSDWSTENSIVYHVIGEPNDMHPTNGNSGNRSFVNNYIHGFIVTADLKNLKGLKPSLVKQLPTVSKDQLKFTYELREEPRWDNGSQLTVEDVIFTLKANKCPLTNNPHFKPYIENLKAIEFNPENPREFTLIMKKIYVHNVAFLTEFPLMQESIWDPNQILRNYSMADLDNPNFNSDEQIIVDWATGFNDYQNGRNTDKIVGLGAYQFSDWKTGQTFTLSRKPNHWTSQLATPSIYETAYADEIIFKLNTDENSQILEFKTQVLDGSNALSNSAFKSLSENASFLEDYYAHITSSFNYSHLRFNMRPDGISHKKLFVDVNVRRAIAHLIPYNEINQVSYGGTRTRIPGPISPLKPSFNKKLELIPFDLQKAKLLLHEAGWEDTDGDLVLDKQIDGQKASFEFDLHYISNSNAWKNMALIISESLYEAGIKCNPIPLEFTVLKGKAKNHDFDAALAAWGGSSFAEDFTQVWHTTSWASKGSNYVGFGNAESDALIDSIKYALTDDIRIPLVHKMQELIYADQPYVFLFASSRTNVIHKRFGNADMYYEKPGILLNNLKLRGVGNVPVTED